MRLHFSPLRFSLHHCRMCGAGADYANLLMRIPKTETMARKRSKRLQTEARRDGITSTTLAEAAFMVGTHCIGYLTTKTRAASALHVMVTYTQVTSLD